MLKIPAVLVSKPVGRSEIVERESRQPGLRLVSIPLSRSLVGAGDALAYQLVAGLAGVDVADELVLRGGVEQAGFAGPIVTGERGRQGILEGGEDVGDNRTVVRSCAGEHCVHCS